PCPDVNLSRVPSTYLRQLTSAGLLIPKHTINLSGTVGQGEFGVVYKATLNGWRGNYEQTVAAKTLKVFSPVGQKRLIEESLVMIKFNHMNVMKLIGVSPHNWPSVYIVMPFMIYGSLLSYLRKNRADFTILNTNDDIDIVNEVGKKLWSMCLQICRGMEYLASLKFVHRDLAARNCMIDEHFVIKVSDFGLTEHIYSRNYFRQLSRREEDGETPVKLPVRWMALESLNDGVFSEKTDVWSFGVTCWEVFTLGKTPYPGMDPHSIVQYLERGERLEKPNNTACSEHIYAIVQECWKVAPEKRPTFSELAKSICESLEVMGGYLDLTTPYLSTAVVSSTENIPTHIPPSIETVTIPSV
ncbi:Tyrosine-protein kinase transforming protein RYK, partial [Geodia barretti]